MNKKAIVTGVTGQDGSFMAQFLLSKGYTVFGIIRNKENIKKLEMWNLDKIKVLMGNLGCEEWLEKAILEIQPDEIYNFAAQSSSVHSWNLIEETIELNEKVPISILNIIKKNNMSTKIFQASSSEIFGFLPSQIPQEEKTKFYPETPYSVTKLYAQNMFRIFREHYGIFATTGILYNHESERRGNDFISKKIARGVVEISNKKLERLELGNLDIERDWGYAPDYVNAAWMIMNSQKPDEYIISTGVTHTVRQFVELAFNRVGIKIKWSGEGIKEVARDNDNNIVVSINEKFYRKIDIVGSVGNNGKIAREIGWKPQHTFENMVEKLVDYELNNKEY